MTKEYECSFTSPDSGRTSCGNDWGSENLEGIRVIVIVRTQEHASCSFVPL